MTPETTTPETTTEDPSRWTIEEAARRLADGETTSVDLTRAVLEQIDRHDVRYGAFLTVDRDGALEEARAADERRAREDDVHPLLGVPIAIKDNLTTRGLKTTCASRLLENYIPPDDATAVAKLRRCGAVLVGKTNLDEFAMGSSSEHSAFYPVKNPWDAERVPGGSSGGSAAAIVYGGAAAALGTDTGGSIRQPASFCGVVGLKPTYGRVYRRGLVAMASSRDQVGPVTKTVRDAALLLGAISGHDPRDATSARRDVPASYLEHIEAGVEGLVIGVVPRLLDAEGLHPGVAEVVQKAQKVYAELGAKIVEVDLPHLDVSISTYYILCASEISANMARYDGIRYGVRQVGDDMWDTYRQSRGRGFGPEVIRRILIGTHALSAGYYDAYYKKASQVRTLIARDFRQALERSDQLLMPVTPTPAFRLGELVDDPLKLYLEDIFTVSLNLAGLPGVSVPAGTVDGLPQGVQLIGRPFDEATVLRTARAFERATEHTLADRLDAAGGKLG